MKLQKSNEQDFFIGIDEVLPLLNNVKKSGKNYTAQCPSHDDHRNSLSVGRGSDGQALLFCHANCEYMDIVQDLGLYKEPIEAPQKIKKEIHEIYDYVDEDGELRYQVVRFVPKSFGQRRPDGKDGWIWNLKGVQRLLYKLPELIHGDSNTVFISEGEKDVNNLTNLGFTATTNSSGASKWDKSFNKYFKGKDVVILPHNDDAGRKHAEVVAKNLYPVAASVRIINLEGLQEHGDVSDWITKDPKSSVDTLKALVLDTKPVEYDEDELEIIDDTLPNYYDGEAAIIGAIFSNPKKATSVDKELVDAFYNPKLKTILKAILYNHENKEGVDLITIAERLRLMKKLDVVGGLAFLKELKDDVTDILNFDQWLKVVHSKAQLRHYIKVADNLKKVAQNELDDPKHIADELSEQVYKIRNRNPERSFIHVGEPIHNIITEVKNFKAGEVTGLATGFKELDDMTAGLQKTDLITIAGRSSMGKEQPLTAKILTPTGWSTMGDMRVGSKVIGFDGKPKNVTGVFPQGLKDIYKVSFSDGSSTECGLDHLWKVLSREDRAQGKSRILSLKDIKDNLHGKGSSRRRKYCIEYVKPVEFIEQSVIMHPYLLGALIGDGSLTKESLMFSNTDEDILEQVRTLLPEHDELRFAEGVDYRIVRKQRTNKPSETKQILKELDMLHLSYDKYIPDVYMINSIENRWELLKGLLDTDGCICKDGWIEFSSTSKILAEQVKELVLGLGGKASLRSRMGSYTINGTKKETVPNYRVRIRFYNENPFYCARKSKIFDQTLGRSRAKYRYIESVEYVGKKEAQCIMVDCPEHLYVTDDYILTHNTAISMNIAYNVSKNHKVAIFSLEMSKEQLIKRILCSEARVNSNHFKTNNLNKHDWERLANVIPEIESRHLYIDDTPNRTASDIRNECYKLAEQVNGLDLVVIDYFQLMGDAGKITTRENVSHNARMMKGLAKELDIPIIALSQLSRAPEARTPPRPFMSDLKESGTIEEVSDVVMLLYREEYYFQNKEECRGLAEVIIGKQRNGPIGSMHYAWLENYSRFENLFEYKPRINFGQ